MLGEGHKLIKSRLNLIKMWLDLIKSRLNLIKSALRSIRSRLNLIRSWLSSIKSGVNLIKSPLRSTRSRLNSIKSRLNLIKSRLGSIRSRLNLIGLRPVVMGSRPRQGSGPWPVGASAQGQKQIFSGFLWKFQASGHAAERPVVLGLQAIGVGRGVDGLSAHFTT
jgi:hypothetical protein